MTGNRTSILTLATVLSACAGDPDLVLPPEISCVIDEEPVSFTSNVTAAEAPGGLVLTADAGLVSQDDITLTVLGSEGTVELGDALERYALELTLDFDSFTSRTLSGTASVTERTNDQVMGTFEAQVVNESDPSDVRTIEDGVFVVPL